MASQQAQEQAGADNLVLLRRRQDESADFPRPGGVGLHPRPDLRNERGKAERPEAPRRDTKADHQDGIEPCDTQGWEIGVPEAQLPFRVVDQPRGRRGELRPAYELRRPFQTREFQRRHADDKAVKRLRHAPGQERILSSLTCRPHPYDTW